MSLGIEINEQDSFAGCGQSRAQVDGGSRLADPPLLIHDGNGPHVIFSYRSLARKMPSDYRSSPLGREERFWHSSRFASLARFSEGLPQIASGAYVTTSMSTLGSILRFRHSAQGLRLFRERELGEENVRTWRSRTGLSSDGARSGLEDPLSRLEAVLL